MKALIRSLSVPHTNETSHSCTLEASPRENAAALSSRFSLNGGKANFPPRSFVFHQHGVTRPPSSVKKPKDRLAFFFLLGRVFLSCDPFSYAALALHGFSPLGQRSSRKWMWFFRFLGRWWVEKAFKVVLSMVLMKSNLKNETFIFFFSFFLFYFLVQFLRTNIASLVNYLMNKKI